MISPFLEEATGNFNFMTTIDPPPSSRMDSSTSSQFSQKTKLGRRMYGQASTTTYGEAHPPTNAPATTSMGANGLQMATTTSTR